MITVIKEAPLNVAAFKAAGDVNENDFKETVLPRVQNVIDEYGELNYLLELDTSLSNFTAGAWLQDVLLGIKHLSKWNRAAIVTDTEGIKIFTGIFSKIMPGEFKAFDCNELDAAIHWAATGEKL